MLERDKNSVPARTSLTCTLLNDNYICKASHLKNVFIPDTLVKQGVLCRGAVFPFRGEAYGKFRRKFSRPVSVFQALSLILAFATLMILIDRHNDCK